MPFDEGSRVRAVVENPIGHTRLPAYLRGRAGRVVRFAGTFEFPGDRAAGMRPAPLERLYTIVFDARDLWGNDAPSDVTICADVFESYLEEA